MGDKKRVVYTEWNEPRVVCPPKGGFPLERLRDYMERCEQERPFSPQEIRDLASLLCDDGLLGSLSGRERDLVRVKIKPTVNSFLQRKAREIRALRGLN